METPGELEYLTEEQFVFVECVQDILAVTPGARWHLVTEPEQLLRYKSVAFAVFILETNPALDMTVSLELGELNFAVIINGIAFRQRRKGEMSFERWIDRNCRLITRMTCGDLKLTTHRLAGTPHRSTLAVQRAGDWHELCKSESHAATAIGYLLPFGIGIALSSEQSTDFANWADAEGVTSVAAAENDDEQDDVAGDATPA